MASRLGCRVSSVGCTVSAVSAEKIIQIDTQRYILRL